jgi:hypothetical protein
MDPKKKQTKSTSLGPKKTVPIVPTKSTSKVCFDHIFVVINLKGGEGSTFQEAHQIVRCIVEHKI